MIFEDIIPNKEYINFPLKDTYCLKDIVLTEEDNILYLNIEFSNHGKRLRNDSINGTRKADLTITVEDVIERTLKKDKKKNKKGANKLPNLSYSNDGKTIEINEKGDKFAYIINNNDTIEEFHSILDRYIKQKITQPKQLAKELKK